MAHIALELRAAVISAAALLGIAVLPWQHSQPTTKAVVTGAKPSLTIELPDVVPMPNVAGPIATWTHPDARPWPLGMVITPPPSADHNALGRQTGIVERVLEAFDQVLRPFRA
jgi:hypothetical protein